MRQSGVSDKTRRQIGRRESAGRDHQRDAKRGAPKNPRHAVAMDENPFKIAVSGWDGLFRWRFAPVIALSLGVYLSVIRRCSSGREVAGSSLSSRLFVERMWCVKMAFGWF